MLTAEKPGLWRSGYDISQDGHIIARWKPSWWRSGGAFELAGRRYEVRANVWGTSYELVGPAGEPIAVAKRVGRKRWTVEAANHIYQFRRTSIWRQDQELLLGDQPVGSVRRTSVWRSSAVADLPGLPVAVQVFVVCVVLAMWAAAAAAGGAGGGGGGG